MKITHYLLLVSAAGLPLSLRAQIVSDVAETTTEVATETEGATEPLELKPIKNLTEPLAKTDTANPDARPLQETPEATEVRDSSRMANPESAPVKDSTVLANPAAEELEEKSDAANSETSPARGTAEVPAMAETTESQKTGDMEKAPTAVEPQTDATAPITEPTLTDPRSVSEMKRDNPSEVNARTGIPPQETIETEGEAMTSPEATGDESASTEATPAMQPTASGAARPEPTEATAAVLEDEVAVDRVAAGRQAAEIEDDDDAETLLKSILGGAVAGAITSKIVNSGNKKNYYERGQRLPVAEVGRTSREREQSVNYLVNRFTGDALASEAPYLTPGTAPRDRTPILYNENNRVVRYSSRSQIPPVLVASDRLKRVEVLPANRFGYSPGPENDRLARVVPPAYRNESAYAVSYRVDPNSVVSRGDILFRQGSTAFLDAYSYDLVVDMAEAMKFSKLANERFVIEGHASAEGDYGNNLQLSQDRAERIARELVRFGVNPNRLVPVGYGEAEAVYAASAPENQRALDRRVVLFRLIE